MADHEDTQHQGSLTRLKIRNNISVHEMDKDDAKMLYQAYRLDKLPSGWSPKKGLEPFEYLASLDEFIQSYYDYAWSVRDEDKTLGVTFGREVAGMVFVGDVIWHAKASKRQKYESYAALISSLDMVLMFTAPLEYKNLFDKLINRKLVRRVGTVYDIGGIDNRTRVYQSRA